MNESMVNHWNGRKCTRSSIFYLIFLYLHRHMQTLFWFLVIAHECVPHQRSNSIKHWSLFILRRNFDWHNCDRRNYNYKVMRCRWPQCKNRSLHQPQLLVLPFISIKYSFIHAFSSKKFYFPHPFQYDMTFFIRLYVKSNIIKVNQCCGSFVWSFVFVLEAIR